MRQNIINFLDSFICYRTCNSIVDTTTLRFNMVQILFLNQSNDIRRL